MRCVDLLLALFFLLRLTGALPIPFEDPSHVGSRDAKVLGTLIARDGNGMQHKDEQKYPPDSDQPFKPVPDEHHYPTQTRVYSGSQLNVAAKKMMTAISSALPFSRKAVFSYPKSGTGFSKKASDNPASPNDIAYHAPIGNTGPQPGPDRIYAHRPPKSNSQYDIGVSYHDKSKPIPPPPVGGGRAARNHPFSIAKPWKTPFGKLNKAGATAQLGLNIAHGVMKNVGPNVASAATKFTKSIGAVKNRIKNGFSKKK